MMPWGAGEQSVHSKRGDKQMTILKLQSEKNKTPDEIPDRVLNKVL